MLHVLLAAVQVSSAVGADCAPDCEYVKKSDAYFGAAISAYGDWNGDGRADFLVSAPRAWARESDGSPGIPRVLLVSGADAKVLMVIRGLRVWSLGDRLHVLDDLDGDGAREILIGRRVIDGRTGSVLRELGDANAEFAESAALGDVNGDGCGEVAWFERFKLRIANPRNGQEIEAPTIKGPAVIAGVADLDGDSIGDLALARRTESEQHAPSFDVELYSLGKRERLLARSFDRPRSRPRLRLAASRSAMGARLLVVSASDWPEEKPPFGDVRVLNLPDLSQRASLTFEHRSSSFGYGIAVGDDLDGDRLADVLVAQPQDLGRGVWGAALVFSSKTGEVLRSQFGEPFDADPFSAVAWLGDVDGDGVEDYGCSSTPLIPDAAIGSDVLVVSGASNRVLFKLPAALRCP